MTLLANSIWMRGAPLLLSMLSILWLAAPRAAPFVLLDAALAEEAGRDCSGWDPRANPEFLACVALNLKSSKGETESVARYESDLIKLSDNVGFDGRAEDLATLKSISLRLKEHARENQDTITIMDNAISAHKTELRSILSPATLPSSSDDQYPAFVRRKLDYLLSDAPSFYNRGPFEIITLSNLAVALQEIYFLDSAAGLDEKPQLKKELQAFAGTDRTAWLRRSVLIFNDIIDRLLSADRDYLPISLRKYSVNDFRYRRAAALLLLGEKERYRQDLRALAVATQNFSLETTDIDHIYVYKVFYTPYRLTTTSDKDSSGAVVSTTHIDDPNIVKKLYNPAQLALASCSVLASAGADSVTRLTRVVKDLVLSDYYVILASSNDQNLLRTIQQGIGASMKARASLQDELEKKVKIAEIPEFTREITDGAVECQVAEEASNRIYAPFSFESRLLPIENFGRFRFHLVAGGRLNADQARLIANFVNADPEFEKLLAPTQILSSGAYIARMKANN